MFYVYLLKSGEHRYIGSTRDLKKRVIEHNSGQNRSTKSYTPWELVYFEGHKLRKVAERRERYLKTSPGRRALNKITSE